MAIYKFIKTKGKDGANIGYSVPRMYKLCCCRQVLKSFGFPYLKDRITGWTVWWLNNEDDYSNAVAILKELKKTKSFTFKVSKWQSREGSVETQGLLSFIF